MNPYLSHIISSRWILSIICGLVFAYMSVNKIIDPKDSMIIIVSVFALYFNKQRSEPKQ